MPAPNRRLNAGDRRKPLNAPLWGAFGDSCRDTLSGVSAVPALFGRPPSSSRLVDAACFVRARLGFPACRLDIFNKRKCKKLVQARSGRPCRALWLGWELVWARPVNR
ncbi:hypothetical protein FPS10_15210 [Pseudoruegeria sp. M32A2M]|nr:hypothetical protein [Pseudoruegeria sp. M32A2M]